MRPSMHFLARHRFFSAAFIAGLALRVVTMLGFPPAIWYGGDSISYLSTALHLYPGTSRESGYGVMLYLLRPFHSFAVVTGVQHLMGLAIGVMIYALLRRYRLPGWGATLAALPVLLDVYQIQLEQEMLASVAFGHTWTGGSVIVAYEGYHRDALPASARDFTATADLPGMS